MFALIEGGIGKTEEEIEREEKEEEEKKDIGKEKTILRHPIYLKSSRKISNLPVKTDKELIDYLSRFMKNLIQTYSETIAYTPEKPVRKRKNRYIFEKRVMLPVSDITIKKDLLNLAFIIDISGSMEEHFLRITSFLRKLIFSLAQYNVKTYLTTFLLNLGELYILLFNPRKLTSGFLKIKFATEDSRTNYTTQSILTTITQFQRKQTFTQVGEDIVFNNMNASGLATYLLKKYDIVSKFSTIDSELENNYRGYYNLLADAFSFIEAGGSVFPNSYKTIYFIHKAINFDFMIEMTDLMIEVSPPNSIENEFCKLHLEIPFIIFTTPEFVSSSDNEAGFLLSKTIKSYNLKEGEHYVIGDLENMRCIEKII